MPLVDALVTLRATPIFGVVVESAGAALFTGVETLQVPIIVAAPVVVQV